MGLGNMEVGLGFAVGGGGNIGVGLGFTVSRRLLKAELRPKAIRALLRPPPLVASLTQALLSFRAVFVERKPSQGREK